jgi:DNA-directed RNA polymerase subunit N (RpoN/RPB10)
MEQNKVNVVKVKEEIEDTFQTFIRKLTQQKDDLFTILDEIEKEKYICNKLKQELKVKIL